MESPLPKKLKEKKQRRIMVRRKIEIKRIENDAKRHTTYTKRRQGLIKKAGELFERTNSAVAIIVFSDAGNCNVFAAPDVNVVLDRYNARSSSASAGEAESSDANGIKAVTEAQKRIDQAVESVKWDEAIEDLGVEELKELYAVLETTQRMLAARAKEIAATVKDIPEPDPSTGDAN